MLSCSDTNELAPAVLTGSLEYPCVPCFQWNNRLRAFWLEPVSIFGSLGLTMLTAVHIGWAFHPACPSNRVDARSFGNHLTAFSASPKCQEVVSAASDQTVTDFAGTDRLLRTKSQVWFTHFMSYQTITVTPSCRTEALPLRQRRDFMTIDFPAVIQRQRRQISGGQPPGCPRDSRGHCRRLSGGLSAETSGQHPGNCPKVAWQRPERCL